MDGYRESRSETSGSQRWERGEVKRGVKECDREFKG